MAEFSEAVVTTAGAEAVNDMLATGNALMFSGLVLGIGTYTDFEKTREELEKITALKEPVARYPIDKAETGSELVRLVTAITNKDYTEGRTITEIGILAEHNGEDVLFCVATAIKALYIPKYDGEYTYTIMHECFVTLGRDVNITIKRKEGAYALQETVDKLEMRVDTCALQETVDRLEEKMNASAIGRETEPQTLTAGQTTLVFEVEIKENDRIEIFTNISDADADHMTVSDNSITVVFMPMAQDIKVKAVIYSELV